MATTTETIGPLQASAGSSSNIKMKASRPFGAQSSIPSELYNLIGDSAPTLVAQFSRPNYKAKIDPDQPRIRWENKEFSNSARSDGLQLRHWMKTSPAPSSDADEYPFAKFNDNPVVSYDYSMDEYTRMLEDADWTKEETDYLFSMAKEYDVRFYVIADRYDFPGGKPRTIQVRILLPPVTMFT